MTATGYNEVTDSELLPGQPLTSGLAFRLRDNPLALAQRGDSAPWLNGIGAIAKFEATTSNNTFTWTVPAGVYRAEFTLVGAGANNSGSESGGNTTVSGVGTAQGGSWNSGLPDSRLIANNGGKARYSISAALFSSCGPGGYIETFVVNTTPGDTHNITVGIGGGRTLGSGAGAGDGGDGYVLIRY